MTEPMLTDDQTGVTPFSQYPHPNGFGFNIADRNGYMRYPTPGLESMDPAFKKDFLSAVMAANGNLPPGSVYGEPIYGYSLLQQMRILQGIASQDEVTLALLFTNRTTNLLIFHDAYFSFLVILASWLLHHRQNAAPCFVDMS